MKKHTLLSLALLLKLAHVTVANSSLRGLQEGEGLCMNEVIVEDGLTFKYRLDEDENNKFYMTASLRYEGIGWLAVGIPGDIPGMIGTHAIIGLPDETGDMNPALYDLQGKSDSGIVPFSDELQTLFDHSIEQDDTSTTLNFSKYIDEPGHNALQAGETNGLIYAYGFSNALGYHQKRDFFMFELSNGCEVVEEVETVTDLCLNEVVVEEGFTFKYRLDEDENNKTYMTAEVSYEGIGWLAVGIPGDIPGMIGTHAIIGLPDETGDMNPALYDLQGKSDSGIVPFSDELQTLFDHSIEQDDTTTTLKFSKYIDEPGHNALQAGETNGLIYAYGFSNALGYHQKRDFFMFELSSDCEVVGEVEDDPPEEVETIEEEPAEDTEETESTETVEDSCTKKVTLEEGLVFEYSIQEDENKDHFINVKFQYEGIGWLSVGIPGDPIGMIGTHAIIGLPDEMSTAMYELNAKADSGINIMPDPSQTLFDHSIDQDDTSTTLTFSKHLIVPGHHPLNLDRRNTILYATGFSNGLGYHKTRGFFEISLESGCSFDDSEADVEAVITFEAPNKNLWRAHGILASLAWAIATPIAVMSSILRDIIPGKGVWFKTHMFLNTMSILFTIAAVIIAFMSFRLSGQPHLSQPHHIIGLVVFILALVQVMNGILRPHVGGDHGVSKKRKQWEYLHKSLGPIIMVLSVYNVFTGLNYYNLRYNSWNWTPIAIAWYALIVVIIIGYKLSKFASKE